MKGLVLRTYLQARIFCFEPAPPTFEILKKNLQGQSVEMFLEGIADFDGEAELSYYPLVPGNSTLHPRQLDSELMDKMFLAFRAVESRWWARLIGRPLFRALVRKVWGRPQHVGGSVLGSGLVDCFLLGFVVVFILWFVLYVLNFLVHFIM